MKKAAVGMLIGLLMMALLVVPALTEGGSAKGTFVKFFTESTLIESIIYKTRSGIIHMWISVPDDMHAVFKPLSKFPNPPGPEYWTEPWEYEPALYIEQVDDDGDLSDFFNVFPEQYWVMMVLQD